MKLRFIFLSLVLVSGCNSTQNSNSKSLEVGKNQINIDSSQSNTFVSSPTRILLGDVPFASSDFRKCVLDINTVNMYADEVTQVDCRDNRFSTYNVQSITGIEYLKNLKSFDIVLGSLATVPELDISPIGSLIHLTHVGIGGNAIKNITPLQSLTSLASLGIWSTGVTNLSPLVSIPTLKYMGLTGNHDLTDLSPLQNVSSLISLIIPSVNSLLAQVGKLNKLQHLTIQTDGAFVNDYPPDLHLISNLSNLIQLHLEFLNLLDLSGLETLTNLNFLHLNYNRINNIIPLFSLPRLSYVELHGNDQIPCTQLSYLSSLYSNSLPIGSDGCVPDEGGPTPQDPSEKLR